MPAGRDELEHRVPLVTEQPKVILDTSKPVVLSKLTSQLTNYTCFDISKSLIAFGATSGGIYVFNRLPCEFVQLIPSKAKTMFQSSSQIIMSLDSRICQLDAKECMLLISTLTRCYICYTVQEQYRQIGQKLRDGEFGACFVTLEKPLINGNAEKKCHIHTIRL